MKVIRYNIRNRSEECQCPVCGFGLFIGDHAYQIAPDGEAGLCSGSCAQEHARRAAQASAIEPESLERTLQSLARDLVALSACRAHSYDDCPACTGETA